MTVTRANARALCCDCADAAAAAAVPTVATVPAFGFVPPWREPPREAAGDDGWPRSFFNPDGKEETFTLTLLATDARLSMYSWDDGGDENLFADGGYAMTGKGREGKDGKLVLSSVRAIIQIRN